MRQLLLAMRMLVTLGLAIAMLGVLAASVDAAPAGKGISAAIMAFESHDDNGTTLPDTGVGSAATAGGDTQLLLLGGALGVVVLGAGIALRRRTA